MPYQEESFGVVPLRYTDDGWSLLLIQHQAGHWGFPKGHAEPADQTGRDTAERELEEETGLQVQCWLSEEPIAEYYSLERNGQPVDKQVHYWLAKVRGELRIQEDEVANARWFDQQSGGSFLHFNEARKLWDRVWQIVVNLDQ